MNRKDLKRKKISRISSKEMTSKRKLIKNQKRIDLLDWQKRRPPHPRSKRLEEPIILEVKVWLIQRMLLG